MSIDINMFEGISFFESLNEDDRNALATTVEHLTVKAGKLLFNTGDAGESLYIVHSGSIELFIKDMAGQRILLATAQPGEMFGELSLFDGRPRTATAQAVVDSELIVINREEFIVLIQKRPQTALHMLGVMSRMTRRADELLRQRIVRNANEEVDEQLTMVEKVADWIAWFSGSMYFLALNAIWFLVWIVINTLPVGIYQFDPFPFGLLTMIVSLEAIFLSIFVLISQNRQAAKDRVRADIEYDINVKAELEVANLHEKIDDIQERMLERFLRLEKRLEKRLERS